MRRQLDDAPQQRQTRPGKTALRSSAFGPWLIQLILWLWLALSAAPLPAETLELTGPAGLTLNAEFAAGKPDLPPVLILHGFLQTHNFPTIRRLADSLAELGYPVLTPTLSLGIDRRNTALACEALHIHSMEQDADEIGRWVGWLRNRYDKEPILIGHSAGSLTLLAYLSGRPSPPVRRAILVTMAHFGTRNEFSYETPEDGARAAAALAAGATGPQPYALAYCRSYVATPADYLSYFDWNRQRVSETLNQIQVPVAVILGDEDARMDDRWLDDLTNSDIDLHLIPGASHFFDQQYEFDLLDEVEQLLKAPSG